MSDLQKVREALCVAKKLIKDDKQETFDYFNEAITTLDALGMGVHSALGEALDGFEMPENEYEEKRYSTLCEEWLKKWGLQPHHAIKDSAEILHGFVGVRDDT